MEMRAKLAIFFSRISTTAMIFAVPSLLVTLVLLDRGGHYSDYQITLWGAAWLFTGALILNEVAYFLRWLDKNKHVKN